MTDQTNDLQDSDLWPDARIAAAQAELDAEKQRRQAEQAADAAATLSPAEREQVEMKKLGEMQGVDGRRKIYSEFGFDPGWR